MVQYATTPVMCEFADAARTNDYNRQLAMDDVYALDPEGVHVLSFSMIHEHRAGVVVDPHMRTMWLLKMKNTKEPLKASLDIPMDMFNSLLLTEDEVDQIKEKSA